MALFCFLGFTSRVSADCTGTFTPPHGLPFVDTEGNARTYNALFAQCAGTSWNYVYYQKNPSYDYVDYNVNNILTLNISGYARYYQGDYYTSEIGQYYSFQIEDTVNVKTSEDLYNQARDTIIYNANYQTTLQLTIARSPEAGGGVASLSGEETEPNCEAEDGLFCGTCGYNYCVGNVPSNSTVKFGAFPNSGYAFAYWEWNGGSSSSTANPEIFTLSGNLDVKAMFRPILQFPLSGTLANRKLSHFFWDDTWTYGECPTGTYKKHVGVDLYATSGEDVAAAHDGVVKKIFTGNHSQWADAIVVESSDGQFTTVYWHVIKYGNLAVNDTVTKGQKIATIANLGGDTHFHLGIRLAPYSDPESYAGALPVADGCGYPAFPEKFIDPETATYE